MESDCSAFSFLIPAANAAASAKRAESMHVAQHALLQATNLADTSMHTVSRVHSKTAMKCVHAAAAAPTCSKGQLNGAFAALRACGIVERGMYA